MPRWTPGPRRDVHGLARVLDEVRGRLPRLASLPKALLDEYAARIDELELDLALLEAIDDVRRVRPLAARRFGTGARTWRLGSRTLRAIADALLDDVPRDAGPRDAGRGETHEARTVPASELAAWMRVTSERAGLRMDVKIEPRLSAGAAAGDHTLFVQAREFGPVEARRLVAHEVLGHAVASHHAASQRLELFAIGTAGSFADQEGLALVLEERAGALDRARLATLAARVVATDRMHEGASFGETARLLHDAIGLPAHAAIVTTERAFRGGGVARDTAYLEGFARVRTALREGRASLDVLRSGRISVASLPALVAAAGRGWARRASLGLDVDACLSDCPPGLPEEEREAVRALLDRELV